jgi:MFS family permease
MGDRLAMVAFPMLIWSATDSELSIGIILALYTLPYVLFGNFAGVVIDRVNKRSLMMVADVMRAGLVFLVPLVAERSLPAVYVLSFLAATAAVFFDPTKMAMLREIVPRDRLMRATSLLATAENLTDVAGYALAGALVAALYAMGSLYSAFHIDAITFLISAAALLLMRYRPPRVAQRAARSFGRELREGMACLRRHRGLLANTIMVLAAAAGLGAVFPLTFLLAYRVLGGGALAFGFFEASIAAGVLIGSIVVAALATSLRKGLAMAVGLGAMGAAIVAVAVAPTVGTAVIPFLLAGFANAIVAISTDTYVQEVVPEGLLGRVWGARLALTQGTFAVSVLVGGALATIVDVRLLFVAAGVLVALPGIVALFICQIRDA